MKILLVEDEPNLREGLKDLLTGAGHLVEVEGDGSAAVKKGIESVFDLVLLDLTLPRLDGIEVCRRLRKTRPGIIIFVLSARGTEEAKVLGLKSGADDYLTKPFGPKELLARIGALERRAKVASVEAETIEWDGCVFDLGHCMAFRGKKEISLTTRETGILRWLYRHKSRSVTRAELLTHVWGMQGDLETRTVDVTMGNLRQKIERNPSEPKIVISVKGVGYAWGGK